ncbi:MAG: hypothetical protein HYT80_06145 [Euryarchaeota archaeon]|nr:hypothetical protein [Euryarchaeota archaeon]
MEEALTRTERLFAAGGLVGGALGVLNAPLAAFASARSYQHAAGEAVATPPDLVEPLFTFADPATVYAAYGRLWAPVLLLLLLGAASLYLRVEATLGRPGRNAFSAVFTGLFMVLLGVVADYWLGPGVLGKRAWGASFLMLTVFGLGVYTVGSTWLGVQLLRPGLAPRWASVPFVLAPVGFLLIPLVPNVPAAQLLVFAAAWILAGVHILRTPRTAPNEAQGKAPSA